MLNKGKIMAEYNLELNNYMEVLEPENKYGYIKKVVLGNSYRSSTGRQSYSIKIYGVTN